MKLYFNYLEISGFTPLLNKFIINSLFKWGLIIITKTEKRDLIE